MTQNASSGPAAPVPTPLPGAPLMESMPAVHPTPTACAVQHGLLLTRNPPRYPTHPPPSFTPRPTTHPPNHAHPLSQVTRKRSDAFQAGEFTSYLRYLVFTLETGVRAMKDGQDKW